MNKCPECGNNETRTINGEEICKSCGLVLDEPISQEYIDDIGKKYAEQPILATAGSRQEDGRIVKKSWLYSTREKNLKQAYAKIELISSTLKIPNNTITEAQFIFKSAVDKGINRGRDNNSIIHASIYAACIINQIPKIPREIIRNTELTRSELLRAYKIIKKELNLQSATINPVDLVNRFGTRLKLKQETITQAIEIIENLQKQNKLEGKKPETIVAAAIYLSAKKNGEKITQRAVANMLGIIEVTIRKRCKEIAIFHNI